MPDFESARSALLVGVIFGALTTALFGMLMLASIADVFQRMLSPWGISVTSVITAGVGFVGTTLFGFMGLSSHGTLSHWQRINDRPLMAWGTLGEPRRTGTRINHRYLYEFPVMVTPPQGAPYATVARWFYPSDLREVIRANARVVVRVDPEDAKAVLVDWDQTRVAMGLPPSSE
jgi:hypothetical protein